MKKRFAVTALVYLSTSCSADAVVILGRVPVPDAGFSDAGFFDASEPVGCAIPIKLAQIRFPGDTIAGPDQVAATSDTLYVATTRDGVARLYSVAWNETTPQVVMQLPDAVAPAILLSTEDTFINFDTRGTSLTMREIRLSTQSVERTLELPFLAGSGAASGGAIHVAARTSTGGATLDSALTITGRWGNNDRDWGFWPLHDATDLAVSGSIGFTAARETRSMSLQRVRRFDLQTGRVYAEWRVGTEAFAAPHDPAAVGVSERGRVVVATAGANGRVIAFDGFGGVEHVFGSGSDVTSIAAWNDRMALTRNEAGDAIVEIYCGI